MTSQGPHPFHVSDLSLSQMYDVFPWLMRHLPGPHQKALSARDFVCSFIKKEIAKHQDAGVPDDPQDFIDFYLAQMEKVGR